MVPETSKQGKTKQRNEKMKKALISAFTTVVAVVALATEQYEFGANYLQINEDVANLSIYSGDFHSVGAAGRIGIITLEAGMTAADIDAAVKKSIAEGGAVWSKKNPTVDLGAVAAGTKLSFYLVRPNGLVVNVGDFGTDAKKGRYLEFDKNGGSGKDERIYNIEVTASTPASGQPLPGALAVFLLAGGVCGAAAVRKHKKA